MKIRVFPWTIFVKVWKMAEGGGKPDLEVVYERERTMRGIKKSSLAYKLRINFTSLMRRLENHVRDIELVLHQFLTQDEILRVGMTDDPRTKINMILRYAIQQNDRERESFMRYLIEHKYITDNDLQEFISFPDDLECKELTVADFNTPEIQSFIERELEVATILDYLYERYLIDLDEYEEIEKAISRIEQIRTLLSILRKRCDDSWTSKFCYILNKFGHQRLLIGIQSIKNRHHIEIQEIDHMPVFGRTVKLDTDHQTQLVLRDRSTTELNRQWRNNDHIITSTRPGCVEFILLSGSEKACHILDTEHQEEKCRTFLQSLTSLPDVKKTIKTGQIFRIKVQMFDSALPIVAKENAKKLEYQLVIKICKPRLIGNLNVEGLINMLVDDEMIDHCTVTTLLQTSDKNLKKEYLVYFLGCCEEEKLKLVLKKASESGELKPLVDQIEKWRCIECYRTILLTHYQNVVDEIDTVMMEKTLKGYSVVPDLLTNVCIYKANTISRAVRAKLFLQYVLTNENILLRFAAVFATMSKAVLTYTSCMYCTNDKSTSALIADTPAFTFVADDVNGDFVIRSSEMKNNGNEIPQESPSFVRQKSESFLESRACRRVMMLGNSFACTSVWNFLQLKSGSITADCNEKFLRHEEEFHGRRYLLNAVISNTSKDLEKGLTNYAELVSPGPHVIIFPITADNNPIEILNEIIAVHGNDIENYILLVLLKPENCSTSEEDDKIIHLCETDVKRRKTNFIFLNTRETNNSSLEQTNDILEKMEEITIGNNLSCYSHKIFDQTEVIIQNAMKEKESRQHLESLQMKRRKIEEELKLIQEPQIPYRDQKLREQVVLKMLKRKSEGKENLQEGKHIGI